MFSTEAEGYQRAAMKMPLEGLKVIDFGRAFVGPMTARFLGDHGATVVRVETGNHPDLLRLSPPYKDNIPGLNRGGYFTKASASKLGISLNLERPGGVEVFKRLVKWADVVIESNAPGVAKRLGLDYEKLRELKPDIIMASTSQLGQEGPYAHFRGFGAQAGALSGVFHITGYPEDYPLAPFGAYNDLVAYQPLMAAIIAALIYRRRTGRGQYLDQSQCEAGVHFLSPLFLEYTANRHVAQRLGNRDPNAAPHGCYRCQGDDRWCVIAVRTDSEWAAFCSVIGKPHLKDEPRFATLLSRKDNEDELDRLVEEWTVNHQCEDVMAVMQAAGVPAGIVATGEDLHRDPQLKHRGHFVVLDHAEMGPHALEAPPFRFSKTGSGPVRSGPLLGEHNEYVCRELLGLTPDEIADLMAEGVFE